MLSWFLTMLPITWGLVEPTDMALLIIVHMKYSVHVLWYQYCLLDISTTSNLVYVFTHNSFSTTHSVKCYQLCVWRWAKFFGCCVWERMKRAPDLSLKKMDASRGKDWRKLLWQFGLILVKLGLNPSAVAANAIFLWERESNYPNCWLNTLWLFLSCLEKDHRWSFKVGSSTRAVFSSRILGI